MGLSARNLPEVQDEKRFIESPSPCKRVSQKSVAGNAAFQAAGVAEVPFQGFRLPSRWPGRYLRKPARCRRSQGAWGGGRRQRSVPFAIPSLLKPLFKVPLPGGRGVGERVTQSVGYEYQHDLTPRLPCTDPTDTSGTPPRSCFRADLFALVLDHPAGGCTRPEKQSGLLVPTGHPEGSWRLPEWSSESVQSRRLSAGNRPR